MTQFQSVEKKNKKQQNKQTNGEAISLYGINFYLAISNKRCREFDTTATKDDNNKKLESTQFVCPLNDNTFLHSVAKHKTKNLLLHTNFVKKKKKNSKNFCVW